ncbi:hypothetical protein B5M42_012930 [Paenibacillus athensensis]|uniref:Uncharacterized protein n=1 Tax=Paenibacillus athensensis TaxID=1967502 RepID=A0A4Y8Q685_9BACL|nr:hypothetical protein [Paenibacillus athensensis]MCD1259738.1 hypothetical protein [Paenibacillus athensensis]
MLAEITSIVNDVQAFTRIWVNIDLKKLDFTIIEIPAPGMPRRDGVEAITIITCPSILIHPQKLL